MKIKLGTVMVHFD